MEEEGSNQRQDFSLARGKILQQSDTIRFVFSNIALPVGCPFDSFRCESRMVLIQFKGSQFKMGLRGSG